MKTNAPVSPPAHRLPVLTEVIQLSEPGDGVTTAGDFQVSPAPAPFMEQPAPFVFESPAPPEWLKRRPSDAKVELPLPDMAPQTPLPSDFSGSWWSRDEGPAVLPSAPAVPLPIPVNLVPVAPAVVPVSEGEVVRRVLHGLDAQLDLMFDHRMHEAVLPALARAADVLMADLREQLASTLHEMVAQAVAIEVARQGQDGGTI